MNDHREPVVAKVCDSAEEGVVLAALLEAEGIPHELVDDRDSLGTPITGEAQSPRGGRVLMVPAQYEALARQILESGSVESEPGPNRTHGGGESAKVSGGGVLDKKLPPGRPNSRST